MAKKIALFIVILLSASSCLAGMDIRVVTFSAPPLIGDSEISRDGVAVELLKATLEGSSFTPVITIAPRARSNVSFYEHKADLFLGSAQALDERYIDQLAGVPLMAIPNVLFCKKVHFPTLLRWSDYSQLKPFKLGVLRGGSSEKIAINNNLDFESVTSLEQLFRKLDSNRTDLVSVFDLSDWVTLKKLYPDRHNEFMRCSDKLLSTATLQATIFNNQPYSDALLSTLGSGLQRIVSNGTWQSIMEKYYGKEHVPAASREIVRRFLALQVLKP